MKALIIDSAVTKLTISAKNDDKSTSSIFDIGMRQSEILLPAIDYVLSKCGMTSDQLDYMAVTQGPGSFTGLRLAYSALKAIECAFNIPIYGISSLLIHSYPYLDSDYFVLSCIDANKDRFYAHILKKDKEILPDGDYTLEELKEKVSNLDKLLICGPDREKLYSLLKDDFKGKEIKYPKFNILTSETLAYLAEEKIKNKEAPLEDYQGPVYLRASEAEIVLKQKEAENNK
ncbi:MAG: tRNA (adenosine(37)-N6)-threonylcarbamoyltransferase complex dimerization subunit type 1 TsaB [Treponema sp.]|nr:tRNA (adenosine(37)-N6)-threonylcarbamoyltransferase complex dimerization subunit type 1 TsaB [Treponema sp.]